MSREETNQSSVPLLGQQRPADDTSSSGTNARDVDSLSAGDVAHLARIAKMNESTEKSLVFHIDTTNTKIDLIFSL
jgi:hypothetical protein